MTRIPDNPRRFLLDAYAAGLAAVDPADAVRKALRADMPAAESIHLVAIGKAAAGMCSGAIDVLGSRVKRALAILPSGSPDTPAGVDRLHAGHPLPDSRSLAAGRRLRSELQASDCQLLLLLISGGASALADIPAAPLLDEELLEIHQALYRLGLDIRGWNAVRQRLSALKAGGLLEWIPPDMKCRQLLVSDVPEDAIVDTPGGAPAIIGSGPAVPLAIPPVLPELPSALIDMLPPWKPRRAEPVPTDIIASNATMLDAIEAFAVRHDVGVCGRGDLSGDAAAMAVQCVARMRAGRPGLYCWGGETTVRLPAEPPAGGRNQHLALAAAIALAGDDDAWLLAVGSDGVDGNTEDAGALVDGETVARGEADALDAETCLAGFRSHEFLASSGDLLHTGPSGSNVMDVVLALHR